MQQEVEHQPLVEAVQGHGAACRPASHGAFRHVAQLGPEVRPPAPERGAQLASAGTVLRSLGDQDRRPADQGAENVVRLGTTPS